MYQYSDVICVIARVPCLVYTRVLTEIVRANSYFFHSKIELGKEQLRSKSVFSTFCASGTVKGGGLHIWFLESKPTRSLAVHRRATQATTRPAEENRKVGKIKYETTNHYIQKGAHLSGRCLSIYSHFSIQKSHLERKSIPYEQLDLALISVVMNS